MKTILLTGTRAPVTLDLARSLRNHGYRVLGADSFEYPLSRRSNAFSRFFTITAPNKNLDLFRDDLIRIIREEKVDLIIPTCEEAFHLARIRHELSCRVLVDDFSKLALLHSKFAFNQWIRELGFAAPSSTVATTIEAAVLAIDSLNEKTVVLKPEFSRFASNTLLLSKSEAKERLSTLSLANGTPWVIQQFLTGPEYCTYSFAIEGILVSHVTYSHEFTAGRGAGICFEAINHPAIENWVRDFVQKTNFTGQIAFDFIDCQTDGQTLMPLECNPRATSGLHLIANHASFVHALANLQEKNDVIRPEFGTLAQLRLAMLVYGLPSIRSLGMLIDWLRIFTCAREVIFDRKDFRPFFDQFVSFFVLIRRARQTKITPLEVSTQDIEWNGNRETPEVVSP